jgi:SAM-dependent methyltransferase
MRPQLLDRLSSHEVSIRSPDYLHRRYLVEGIAEACEKYAKGRLIDIGCGNKPYRALMPQVTDYVGCDVVQSSKQCVDILCEATDIPLPSESFDTAFSSQTLEHVADHKTLLRESFRLLRSGGHLIASAPMYWPLHEEPHDYFRFTKYGLRYLLEEAGYVDVELRANGGQWALCGLVLIQCFKFRRRMRVPINKLFAWLDAKHKDESNTQNYVVVGRKP